MSDYNVAWLMDPPNQSVCGSCWAVCFHISPLDHYSIANKTKTPVLSAVVTASCETL